MHKYLLFINTKRIGDDTMLENKKNNNNPYNIIDHDICNVSSANDCTGLIPAIVDREDAEDFYQEIYSFEHPVSQNVDKNKK